MFKRLSMLGAIALVFGVSVRYFAPTPLAIAKTASTTDEMNIVRSGSGQIRWEPVLRHSVPNLTDIALAPDGSSLAWVDERGSVRRILNANGKTLWRTAPLSGVNDVEVSSRGTVLAFSRLNPAKSTLRVLDAAAGDKKSALIPVDGAIWSVSLTASGTQAIVGTGKSLLYNIPLRCDLIHPGAPLATSGIPETVDASSQKPFAFFSTSQQSGVGIWGLDKTPLWQQKESRANYHYSVTLSADGSTAIALATQGVREESARLHVWDAATGKLRWIENLDGFAPKVALSADASVIAVTFSRFVESGKVERKLVVFDGDGRRIVDEKGGTFFSPELVGMSPDGKHITVRDAAGSIWTLDSRGHTVARLPHNAADGDLKHVLLSRNGNFLLTCNTNGNMMLYRATAR